MVCGLLGKEERQKEKSIHLGWGKWKREREKKENKGQEQMSCLVEYYEISKVTALHDLMTFRKFYKITKSLR